MRIAILSKACVMGPYQRKLEELAKLMGRGLTALVPPCWRDERGIVYLDRLHTEGYELRVVPLALNGHFHLHFFLGLDRVLRQLRPHILHIDEEPYNLATFLALRAARRVGAKFLFFAWQNIPRRYPPPFSCMERYVLAHTDYALAGNSEAETVLRTKGYRGPGKIIPQFGVDPEIFHLSPPDRGPRDVSLRPFVVGYSGRLVREKGVDLLLRAVAQLKGAWQLWILGDGPERTGLASLSAELGITDRVVIKGMMPASQMPKQYPLLDALVLPSRTFPNWKEQFGRVLIEAMACGVPVVGSDSGEIPNVIGEAGLIFPEGDVAALSAALACLQTDSRLRRDLGRQGRARVIANYTQAHVAASTYEVYQELMRASPQG